MKTLTLPKFSENGLRIFWLLMSILITTLLIFYIFQINAITKDFYVLKTHQKQLAELSQENKNIEMSYSQTNSLKNIESLVKTLDYRKVEKIHYIRVLGGIVASK